MRRAMVAVALCVGLTGSGVAVAPRAIAQEPRFPHPGIGLCVPLPDPPLLLDWTIRAIKVAIVGEIDCGL